MNPLDPLEFQAFVRNLNKEMPIHTDTTAKIKRSYSQGMPKNLMEYSACVNNKFLNDNLAIIEEMHHRDQIHYIPKWFRDYQIKYYSKFGILNKDSFFATRMRDGYRKYFSPNLTEIRAIGHHASMSFHNVGFASVIGNTKVFGSVLEAYTGTETNDNVAPNQLLASKMSTNANIGDWYNQCAVKRGTTGSGNNYRMGIYADNGSGFPGALYGQTAETAYGATGSYTYVDLTNGGAAATTAITWVTLANDGTGSKIVRILSGVSNARLRGNTTTWSYGALPDPHSGSYAEDGNNFLYKCRGI